MSTTPPSTLDTSSPSADQPAQRLNSWKEIAAWFGRDVRTAQLWEKNECLPVHRLKHSTRASIYAHPAELDEWLRNRGDQSRSAQAPDDLNALETALEADIAPRARPSRAIYGGAVLAIVAGLAVFAYFHERSRLHPQIAAPITLAVLPFEDLSAGESGDFLADGLTEDLITDFGRAESLHVTSRRSVMQFKNSRESLSEIAKRLHVAVILEGKLAHLNGQVRITAQLLDASHDRIIWAESYTRQTNDILSLQDEVAKEIAVTATRTMQSNPNSHSLDTDPDTRMPSKLSGH
jgi:TolB-like protein